MEISVETARRFSLWKQGFCNRPSQEKTQVLETIRKLGCVQIDTINVVERSHYLTLWSRLGSYDKEFLGQLLYPDRELFEFWAHAASIIPISHYRYFLHAMDEYRKGLKAGGESKLKEKAYVLDQVLDEIRRKGPLSSHDFKDGVEEKRKGLGWWDWKPTKIALEMLFNAGILMVAYRKNFERYYDLTENVLPSQVDLTKPTEEETQRFFTEKAFDALGVATQNDVAGYYYQWSTRVSLGRKALDKAFQHLLDENELEEVIIGGLPQKYYILSNDCEAAQNIALGDVECFDEVTFLSPFDNLIWSKGRITDLFNFSPKLEAYMPRNKRKFGYYSMNILYKNRLVGRLDPKLHRERKTLEIKRLRLEEGFEPDSEFEDKLTGAFRRLMEFTKAENIEFGEVIPEKTRINNPCC